jgi:hypothetical protein
VSQWWAARTQNEKIAVVGAGALALLLVVGMLKGKKKRGFTANKRHHRRHRSNPKAVGAAA